MKQDKQHWQAFIRLCRISDGEHLDQLLQFFLTAEEQHMIATRVEIIIELLGANKPQRQIAAETGVSIAKITRGSNELKRASHDLLTFLRKELLVD